MTLPLHMKVCVLTTLLVDLSQIGYHVRTVGLEVTIWFHGLVPGDFRR